MRRLLPLATLLMGVPVTSEAATIIQSSSNHDAFQGAFLGFDPLLGTLNSVTLHIDSLERRLPDIRSDLQEISWSVLGKRDFYVYVRPTDADSVLAGHFEVPLTGSGTIGPANGVYDMLITGSGTFSIDPAFVPSSAGHIDPYVTRILSANLGFFDFSDATFTPDIGSPFNFYAQSGGPDAWTFQWYTLTYDYTPSEIGGAVPEPSTWGMALLGFGIAGAALRRSRKPRQARASLRNLS